MLGLTPLALARRYKAKRLFLRPRSPLGREPLYLKEETEEHGDEADVSGERFIATSPVEVIDE